MESNHGLIILLSDSSDAEQDPETPNFLDSTEKKNLTPKK